MNMNKYQEALNRIKEIVIDEHADGYYQPRTVEHFYYGAISDLNELVEKATSINPTIIGDSFDDYYICPICGNLVNYMQKYCNNCGQKLLWLKSDGKW